MKFGSEAFLATFQVLACHMGLVAHTTVQTQNISDTAENFLGQCYSGCSLDEESAVLKASALAVTSA